MKKMISFCCVLILLAGVFAGCEKKPDEAQLALQAEWLNVLVFQDDLLSLTDWAFDYAEAFAEENTWESLLKAQAACAAALEAAKALPVPEKTVTTEQYTDLMEQKIEAEVVSQEFQMMYTYRQQTVDTLTRLQTMLRDDVFMIPSVEVLPKWLDTAREVDRITGEYYILTTNYLALQLENTQVWEETTEPLPVLNQIQLEWNDDSEAIEKQTEELLDELEVQVNLQNEFLGTADYTLAVVRQASETGDTSKLSTLMHDIPGREFYYPMPSWVMPDARWRFYVPGENPEEPREITFGDELTKMPCRVEVICPGVTRDGMEAYFTAISFWGLEPEEQEPDHWLISVGDYRMELILTDSGAEIVLSGDIACLIPELYLIAILLK